MNTVLHIAAAVALLGLSACATPQATPPGPPVPATLHLGVSGHTAPVLDAEGRGQITLVHDGADEPFTVAFQNDAPSRFELVPGHYDVTAIGGLTCRGMGFEVEDGAGGRHLGALRAEIIKTSYYVAMIAGRPADDAEISKFAAETGTAPSNIDDRPFSAAEAAPCFIHRSGPGQTWHDRPLGEKILLGIGFAGFCAVALASGGFCAF